MENRRTCWGRFLARCSQLESSKTISNDRKDLNEETDVELFSRFCFVDFLYSLQDNTRKKGANSDHYKMNNSALK